FHALPPELVRHLDLETVAVRAYLLEVDGFERPAAETFVTAGRVAEGHASNGLNVLGGALAENQPAKGPVDNPDAVQITRTQHQIGFLGRLKEHRNII